jgi:hypothetical protein
LGNIRDTTRVPLGVYHGLRLGVVLHAQFPPDVFQGTRGL